MFQGNSSYLLVGESASSGLLKQLSNVFVLVLLSSYANACTWRFYEALMADVRDIAINPIQVLVFGLRVKHAGFVYHFTCSLLESLSIAMRALHEA